MPGAVPVDGTAAGPDHPGLIPASLLELDRRDDEPWRHIRRSGRDWTVDVICVVLSAVVGAAFLASTATDQPAPSPFVLVVDGVLGVVSCAALWLRRRFPVGVAVLTALLSIFSVATAVAATIAMFTVAVHRRMQTALAHRAAQRRDRRAVLRRAPAERADQRRAGGVVDLDGDDDGHVGGGGGVGDAGAGPPATGRVAARTGPNAPRPSSGYLPTRPDRPNGPASPARCTTSSPTGCR